MDIEKYEKFKFDLGKKEKETLKSFFSNEDYKLIRQALKLQQLLENNELSEYILYQEDDLNIFVFNQDLDLKSSFDIQKVNPFKKLKKKHLEKIYKSIIKQTKEIIKDLKHYEEIAKELKEITEQHKELFEKINVFFGFGYIREYDNFEITNNNLIKTDNILIELDLFYNLHNHRYKIKFLNEFSKDTNIEKYKKKLNKKLKQLEKEVDKDIKELIKDARI